MSDKGLYGGKWECSYCGSFSSPVQKSGNLHGYEIDHLCGGHTSVHYSEEDIEEDSTYVNYIDNCKEYKKKVLREKRLKKLLDNE